MEINATRKLALVGGRATGDLPARIAAHLDMPLQEAGLKTFSGGEVYCRYEDSVRDTDLFIIQSLAQTEDMSPNDALVELQLLVDAAVGASAHRVTAVVPWYGYCRQDKKSAPREPISARVVARTLEAVGINRLITMDLHAGQLQGLFTVPAEHLTALPLLIETIRKDYDPNETVIIAPDAGRVKLTQKVAERLDMPYALLEKKRPKHQQAETGYVIGDVEGKLAIVIDDIIDTAGTLASSAQTLMNHGTTGVVAMATHGVLSGNAYETIANSCIERIVVTDTIPLGAEFKPDNAGDQIEQLDTSELWANSITACFAGSSVSELMDGQNQVF